MTAAEAASGRRETSRVICGRRRYEIVRKLGAGGMAEVYLCKVLAGEDITRQVAVKLIREDFAQRAAFRAALAQEARFAAVLTHPNIVNVLDLDEDDRGRPFLTMEYVEGVDLVQLSAGRAVPPPIAIYLAVEVLRGLGYAHSLPDGASPIRGILHRDVSPQNILVDRHGAVKVADFGIAKAISASGIVSPRIGKAAYMSPEQAASNPLDARSDLFSVGVVIWELLTGGRMFAGLHAKDVLARIILAPIPHPSTVAPIAADLEAVIMRLLAKQRDDRYPSASEAVDALLQCADAPKDGPGELASYVTARLHDPSALDVGANEPTATEPTPTTEEVLTAGPSHVVSAPREYASLIRRAVSRCRTFVIGRAKRRR